MLYLLKGHPTVLNTDTVMGSTLVRSFNHWFVLSEDLLTGVGEVEEAVRVPAAGVELAQHDGHGRDGARGRREEEEGLGLADRQSVSDNHSQLGQGDVARHQKLYLHLCSCNTYNKCVQVQCGSKELLNTGPCPSRAAASPSYTWQDE